MKRTAVLAGIALVAFGALAPAPPAAAQQPIKVGVIYGLGGAAGGSAPNATRAIPARTAVRFIAPPSGDIALVEEKLHSICA